MWPRSIKLVPRNHLSHPDMVGPAPEEVAGVVAALVDPVAVHNFQVQGVEDNLQMVEAAQDVLEEVAEASPVVEAAVFQVAGVVPVAQAAVQCNMEDSIKEMGASRAICPWSLRETAPKVTNSGENSES